MGEITLSDTEKVKNIFAKMFAKNKYRGNMQVNFTEDVITHVRLELILNAPDIERLLKMSP